MISRLIRVPSWILLLSLAPGAWTQLSSSTSAASTPAPASACSCIDPVMMFFLGMLSGVVIGGLVWYLIQRRKAGQPLVPRPSAPSIWPHWPHWPSHTPGPTQPQPYAPVPTQPYAPPQQEFAGGLGWYQTEYQVVSVPPWL